MSDHIRQDLFVVSKYIPAHSRVLDLGCGDGELLAWLMAKRSCIGTGVERDPEMALEAIGRGIPLLGIDIDTDLDMFASDSYDVVVLSRTLQAVARPDLVLAQLGRIAPRVIVSMPNFGYWRHRVRLLSGHMPESTDLPYSWYESPNMKYTTLADLEPLFADVGLAISKKIPLVASGKRSVTSLAANLMASSAIYLLHRTSSAQAS